MQRNQVFDRRWSLHSLWRKPSGIYHARVRDLKTGQVYQFSTRSRQHRAAQQAALEFVEELRSPATKEAVFGEAFEEWLGTRTCKELTKKQYRAYYEGHYRRWAELPVSEVGVAQVERLLAGEQRKGRAPRTLQFHLTLLRSFFGWAVARKYCAEDPTATLRAPRQRRSRPKVLTAEEARRLLGAASERLEPVVRVALMTGLRRSNVLELGRRHVDLDEGVMRIPAEEMKAGAELEVPVAAPLRVWLEGRDVDPFVGRLSLAQLRADWQRATAAAGVELKFHGLRATFASWIAPACSYATTQALLGHSLPGVTGRYVDTSLETMRRALEALPELWKE